jgi:drug/metabolite transporter (DMT)-like permease
VGLVHVLHRPGRQRLGRPADHAAHRLIAAALAYGRRISTPTPDTVLPAPGAPDLPHGPERPALGFALVVAGSVLFGLAGSVSKVVLDAGVAPARLTALRCLGAAVGLLVYLVATNPSRLRIARGDIPVLVAVGLSGAALIQWLYFVAIDRLPVGIALLLEFTGPLLVAVWSRVVLRHQVAPGVWLALVLALVGLATVARIWSDTGLDGVGVLAGLGAACCLAAFYLLSKHALTTRRLHSLTLSFWMFATASMFWAVAQPWWDFDVAVLGRSVSLQGALEDLSVPLWVPVAWIIVLATLVPYALAVAALAHLSPTTTGIVGMTEPVIASAVAWVWLGQSLTIVQLLGAALVLVAVAMVQLRSQPQPTPATT